MSGYTLAIGHSGRYAHKICGRPTSQGADCPNCARPLMRLLALDLSDPCLDFIGLDLPTLELLFCWRCGVAQGPFYYRVEPDSVEIIRAEPGQPESDFPYEEYPEVFEVAPVELVKAGRRGDEPRHQVGGKPFLYDDTSFTCVECGDPMEVIATVADSNTDPRGFVDNAYVQVVFYVCRPCQMIGARQECD